MKRVCLSRIIISVAVVGGALAAAYWPRPAGGELYRHYEGRSDIKVSYFKDYKINDSVTVDVTMLEAKTDSAWALLQSDFNIMPITPYLMGLVSKGKDIVGSSKASGHTKDGIPLFQNELIAFSHLKETVYVFHTENESQEYAVLHHNIDKQLDNKSIISQKNNY